VLEDHAQEFSSRADSRLSHNMLEVPFNRIFGDAEFVGNLLITRAGHERLHDLQLSAGQVEPFPELLKIDLVPLSGHLLDENHDMKRLLHGIMSLSDEKSTAAKCGLLYGHEHGLGEHAAVAELLGLGRRLEIFDQTVVEAEDDFGNFELTGVFFSRGRLGAAQHGKKIECALIEKFGLLAMIEDKNAGNRAFCCNCQEIHLCPQEG
jgi:hypothetical protein